MTLRRRLIAVQVALVAVGLTAFSVVSYRLYSNSAYHQIDDQLESVAPLLSLGLYSGSGQGSQPAGGQPGGRDSDDDQVGGPPADAAHNLPPGSFSQLRSTTGAILRSQQVPCVSPPGSSTRAAPSRCPLPRLSASIADPQNRQRSDPHGVFHRRVDQLSCPGS